MRTRTARRSVELAIALLVFAAPLASHDGEDAGERGRTGAVTAAAPSTTSAGSADPTVWERATTGLPGVLVAVIDTGVAPTPDLADRVDPGQSLVGGLATLDESGHGTAVAGIVAGAAGVCRTCRILPLRVSAGAGGTAASEDIATAVDIAVSRGAAVINLSMVATSPTESERAAVERAVAAGVVVVGAAGNAGSSTPSYPASYPGVLSVGAVGDDGLIAAFSNRGPWVSVLAPGCGRSHAPGGGEVLFCGTSAAAPYVAGVAAVLRAAVPSATAAAVVAAIRSSARAATGVADGIVDPTAALAAVGGSPVPLPATGKVVPSPGVATKKPRPRTPPVAKAPRVEPRPAGRLAKVPRAISGRPR